MNALADMLMERLLGRFVRLGERKYDFAGGTFSLRGVQIREDVLDGLGLPFAIRGGEIGELEVSVPWTKIKSESVVVKMHKLSLILAPVSESEWNEATERRCATARKERALANLRPKRREAAGGGDPKGGGGWMERLTDRVLDNLQLIVTSVVVRVEDYSHSHTPFALEVAMDSLWMHPAHVSTPEAGGAQPPPASKPFQQREMLVCSLCAYLLDADRLPPKASAPTLGPAELQARALPRTLSRGVAHPPNGLRSPPLRTRPRWARRSWRRERSRGRAPEASHTLASSPTPSLSPPCAHPTLIATRRPPGATHRASSSPKEEASSRFASLGLAPLRRSGAPRELRASGRRSRGDAAQLAPLHPRAALVRHGALLQEHRLGAAAAARALPRERSPAGSFWVAFVGIRVLVFVSVSLGEVGLGSSV